MDNFKYLDLSGLKMLIKYMKQALTITVNGNAPDANNNIDIKSTIMNSVYPIGSIYLTLNNNNPATLLGIGTWKALSGSTPGYYLMTGGESSSSYPVVVVNSATSGSNYSFSNAADSKYLKGTGDVTLAAANIPKHTHPITNSSLTVSSAGGHTHDKGSMNIQGSFGDNRRGESYLSGAFSQGSGTSAGSGHSSGTTYKIQFNAKDSWSGTTSSNGAHTHTISGLATQTGNNQSSNPTAVTIKPRGIPVFAWVRTA